MITENESAEDRPGRSAAGRKRLRNSAVPKPFEYFSGTDIPMCCSAEKLSLGNSTNRTLRLTCTAVDAGISVDFIMSVTLGNGLYRTLCSTGTAADAGITYYTWHNYNLLVVRMSICPYMILMYSSVSAAIRNGPG